MMIFGRIAEYGERAYPLPCGLGVFLPVQFLAIGRREIAYWTVFIEDGRGNGPSG